MNTNLLLWGAVALGGGYLAYKSRGTKQLLYGGVAAYSALQAMKANAGGSMAGTTVSIVPSLYGAPVFYE